MWPSRRPAFPNPIWCDSLEIPVRRHARRRGRKRTTTVRARLEVYLTGDRVDSSGKTVDHVAKTVQPYEIANLRRHEREIFAHVSTTYAAPRTDR